MANETELSNFITIGNAVSALVSPAFVNESITLSMVHVEDFPDNTNVTKFAKSGSLTAETLAQTTAYTYSASSELTDTSVTCTAEKGAIATKLTVEALRFGQPGARFERIGTEHGRALGRLFDASVFALFTSATNGVTATDVLTKDDLLDAQYNVLSSAMGAVSGRLKAIIDYKGANELRKELTSISAAAFGNESMISLINGAPNPSNGLVGSLAGIEVHQTSGLGTSGGDDIGCVFDPVYAYAAGMGGEFKTDIDYLGASGGYLYEISSYMFFKVVIWNNTAACKLLSDS